MSKFLDFLSGLPDLGAKPQKSMRSSDFTLERMEVLMETLGNPERQFPSIHIAGTNGKGSVAAFCDAALQAQGYKVGKFTSPHIAGALAGIVVNGVRVDESDLEQSFELLFPHLKSQKDWTHFEVVTALAFLHFACAKVDAGVIEVGLGGRLDATNVLRPLVSVITPIDYDHTSILGNSLAEIAREKVGIIKPGVPLVISPQAEEARVSILTVAKEKNVQVTEIGKEMLFARTSFDLSGQEFDVWDAAALSKKTQLKIGLLGMHQVENAATAFGVLQVAAQHGLTISEDAIRRGFESARWQGRFEVVQKNPPVILDAAHSPGAAQTLRNALNEYFPGQPVIMVLGVSADKDLVGIIEPLRDRIVGAIATQSAHPRAVPADELQGKLAALGVQAESELDPFHAAQRALGQRVANAVILVCGSVFLVEQVAASIEAIEKR